MQLFSFGHPCEHQLRRACIGGSSCPLNGYPDAWCCSFIKGKINFKRDKPCEGPRCRWGFAHPSQNQFELVTQVLNEARPIAIKIDDAEDADILSFHIDTPHIADTVQCAIYMMRHSPTTCGRRVGQLLAYAAVKAGDPKLFMQLLKTMKKPVDSYILGAYAYLTNGNPPQPNPPAVTSPQATAAAAAGAPGAKATNTAASKKAAPATTVVVMKREDLIEELKNDTVDLMNAALSQGGHLVDREDQHMLQATFILALRQYKKNNRKRHEMLEAALLKFGNRPMPREVPREEQPAASVSVDGSATAAAMGAATGSTTTPAPPSVGMPEELATTGSTPRLPSPLPAADLRPADQATSSVATAAATATGATTTTAAAATGTVTPGAVASAAAVPQQPTTPPLSNAHRATPQSHWQPQQAQGSTTPRASSAGAAAVNHNNSASASSLSGISKLAAIAVPRPLSYEPIRFNQPFDRPPLVFGGLFSIGSPVLAPLGPASVVPAAATHTPAAQPSWDAINSPSYRAQATTSPSHSKVSGSSGGAGAPGSAVGGGVRTAAFAEGRGFSTGGAADHMMGGGYETHLDRGGMKEVDDTWC